MSRRGESAHPGREYEAFLFAPLGDDRNGTPLAIASILGRMSLDPWSEAASLAALPTDAAERKLAALIDAMPNQPPGHPESATLAAHLIKLLPTARSKPALPAGPDLIIPTRAKKSHRRLIYLIGLVISCILLFGAFFA
jgi:hypothetical protein